MKLKTCIYSVSFLALLALTVSSKGFNAYPYKISGTFFQPWLVELWSADDWSEHLRELTQAGIDDHIIWQWTIDSETKQAWYPTQMPGFSMVKGMACADPVGTSLAQAKLAGIKVWLGLNWTDAWWDMYANDDSWLSREFLVSRATVEELWNLYGKDYGGDIAGFYIAMEVDNSNFSSRETQDRIKTAYRFLADFIHQTTGKPVMIAPFCDDSGIMDQHGWEAMWKNILADASIDIVNLQDGCGASDDGSRTHTTTNSVAPWFAATKNAIDDVSPHTQLWSALETFSMDAEGNCFSVKDFSRIGRQIEKERKYVSRFSSFSIMHYQTRLSKGSYSQRAKEQYLRLLGKYGKVR